MQTLSIGVFRIFGNELEQPVPDHLVAQQLHDNRKLAIHDIFDNQQEMQVTEWGQTNDSGPHEFVTIAVSIGATAFTNHVLIPAAKYIFEKIADKAIDTAIEKSVSWLLSKFKKKQAEKKIGSIEVRLPNGVVLNVVNPGKETVIKFDVHGEPFEISF